MHWHIPVTHRNTCTLLPDSSSLWTNTSHSSTSRSPSQACFLGASLELCTVCASQAAPAARRGRGEPSRNPTDTGASRGCGTGPVLPAHLPDVPLIVTAGYAPRAAPSPAAPRPGTEPPPVPPPGPPPPSPAAQAPAQPLHGDMAGAAHHHRVGGVLEELLLQRPLLVLLLLVDLVKVRHGRARASGGREQRGRRDEAGRGGRRERAGRDAPIPARVAAEPRRSGSSGG